MPASIKDNLITSLRVSLKDKHNGTYRGNLVLKNWTVFTGEEGFRYVDNSVASTTKPAELVDPVGASYYVIAVVLVYGMSIVALIASHIKRKHGKLIEDRQINKYLREFQTVKDKESRESYRTLKKRIKEQINWDKPQTKTGNTLHQNLSHALLPMIAFGVSVPQLHPSNSVSNIYWQRSRSNSLFNSQNSVYTPRSRASSVGSHNSVSSVATPTTQHIGERSPALSRDRHERKRGLPNLTGMPHHHDFPLEKILEESMSRENSVRRKGSKRHRNSEVMSSTASLYNQELAKGVIYNPNYDPTSAGAPEPMDNLPHGLPEIAGSTSELGSSVEAMETSSAKPNGGQSLGDSGMGRSPSPTASMDLGESAATHMEKIKQQIYSPSLLSQQYEDGIRQNSSISHYTDNNPAMTKTPDSLQFTNETEFNQTRLNLTTENMAIQPSVHKGARKRPRTPPPPIKTNSIYLTVPQSPHRGSNQEDKVWVPSPIPSPNIQDNRDEGRFNKGFSRSPSPAKSNGGLFNRRLVRQGNVSVFDNEGEDRGASPVISSKFSDSNHSDKTGLKHEQFAPELKSHDQNLVSHAHCSPHRSHDRSPVSHDRGSSPHSRYYLSSDESDSESELLQITCL